MILISFQKCPYHQASKIRRSWLKQRLPFLLVSAGFLDAWLTISYEYEQVWLHLSDIHIPLGIIRYGLPQFISTAYLSCLFSSLRSSILFSQNSTAELIRDRMNITFHRPFPE